MNKKSIFIIIGIILVLFIIFMFSFNNNVKRECYDIAGGGFNIIFNTNGGNAIDNMHGCIACSPDSYPLLPIPIKDGYTFDGWYYDKNFNNKVDGDSSLNVNPKGIFNDDGCRIGYEDITLYAKWK